MPMGNSVVIELQFYYQEGPHSRRAGLHGRFKVQSESMQLIARLARTETLSVSFKYADVLCVACLCALFFCGK